ncbi:MAG TPA: phage tail protein [Myxococcales bacterium]|nr:phage tail protein [Myxococcales bacterium]
MADDRNVPYGAFNFQITFDGDDLGVGGFSDVSGLTNEFTMAEYREGTDQENHTRKVPGIFKAGDVTLKRGIVNSQKMYGWVDDVRKRGPLGKKRSVVIRLQDEAHKVVQSWTLHEVTPMKMTGPTLAAKGGGDVAMEELVLSAEKVTMGFPEE